MKNPANHLTMLPNLPIMDKHNSLPSNSGRGWILWVRLFGWRPTLATEAPRTLRSQRWCTAVLIWPATAPVLWWGCRAAACSSAPANERSKLVTTGRNQVTAWLDIVLADKAIRAGTALDKVLKNVADSKIFSDSTNPATLMAKQ